MSARSLGVGLLCAAGAVLAHGLAGGEVAGGLPLALLLPMSVLVCAVVLRRAADPAALAAAALLTQLGWHVSLMATAGHGHGHGHETVAATLSMLGAHLLVVALSVAAALGAERALAGLLLDLLGAVLLRGLPLPDDTDPTTGSVRVAIRGRLDPDPARVGWVPVGRRGPPRLLPTA